MAGTGQLIIVATPIGNLGDMTFRAVDELKSADRVLAEDTRRARILLTHFGISKTPTAFHEHSSVQTIDRLIEALRGGARVALISDAGMPLVADPGWMLARRAREAGIPVTCVPGASAVVTALVLSGAMPVPFYFEGYLPKTRAALARKLEELRGRREAVVAFVSPHTLPATFDAIDAAMPERELACCREMTKLHEEVVRGRAAELKKHFTCGSIRGEFTLVMFPLSAEEENGDDTEAVRVRIAELKARGVRVRDGVDTLQAEGVRLSRRELYTLWHEADDKGG